MRYWGVWEEVSIGLVGVEIETFKIINIEIPDVYKLLNCC
jgi:hypothetical protein